MKQVEIIKLGMTDTRLSLQEKTNEFCEDHTVESITYHQEGNGFTPCVFIVYEKQT